MLLDPTYGAPRNRVIIGNHMSPYTHQHTLYYWSRVTRICVTILDHHCFRYGLSSVWCQTIIWNNDRLLSIRPFWTKLNVDQNNTNFIKQNEFEVASGNCRPICLDLNVLMIEGTIAETSDATLKNMYEYLIWIHNGLFIRPMYIWDISWDISLGTIFANGSWDTYISSTRPKCQEYSLSIIDPYLRQNRHGGICTCILQKHGDATFPLSVVYVYEWSPRKMVM